MLHFQEAQKKLQENNLPEAITLADQAIAEKFIGAHIIKGQAYMKQGKFKEANESADQLIAADPKSVPIPQQSIFSFKALISQQLGNFADAVKYYDLAIVTFPAIGNDKNTMNNKGLAHQKLGELDKALACFQKVLTLDGNHEMALMNLGSVFDELKQYDEAVKAYENAENIIKPNRPEFFLNKGIAEMHAQQIEKAIKSYQKALDLKPDYPQALVQMGQAQIIMNQNEEAIKTYTKVLQTQSNNTTALYNKGNAHKNLKQWKEAVECFDKVIQLEKQNLDLMFSAIFFKGQVLHELKDDKGAIQNFEEALQLKKDDPVLYFSYGNSLKALGQQQKAIEQYDKALELKSDFKEALNNKGSTLQGLSKYQEAIQCYDAFLAISESADIFNNKGNALKGLKQYPEALAVFQKALQLQGNHILALTNQAQVYLIIGKKLEAIKDLQKVDELLKDSKNYEDLSQSNVEYIRKSVQQIIAIENEFTQQNKKIQEALQEEDKDDPKVKEVMKQVTELQEQKDKQNESTLSSMQVGQKSDQKTLSPEEFAAKLDAMFKEAIRLKQENRNLKLQQKEHAKQLEENKEEQKEIKQVMVDGGVYDMANIKRKFDEFKNEAVDLYDYSKAFYWTFINYCDAMRIAETGVLEVDNEASQTSTTKLAVKATSAVLDLGSKIPIFGGIFGVINGAVQGIYKELARKKEEDRRRAINSIIMKNKDANSKEEWSMVVAKAAQEIAERKRTMFQQKNLLRFQMSVTGILKSRQSAISWIKEQIAKLKAMALDADVKMYQSVGGEEASQDIIVVLSYMYKEHESIVKSDQPLHEQIADMVVKKDGDFSLNFLGMLDGFQEEAQKQVQAVTEVTRDSSCCQIM